jgi:predicted AAA+ superfamily ATPase
MIHRSVNPSKLLSFFVFGARGVGKSTWLQGEFAQDNHLWIDLTDPQIERRYSRKPEIFLSEWKEMVSTLDPVSQKNLWIIIDEVQKIPAILDAVHTGIQRHKIKFALTGSSARKLKRGAANLLAGRALTYHMHPLTVEELGPEFKLESYLQWGGLPMLLEIENQSDRQKYLMSYVDTYLREEIQMEQLVRKMEPFRMFLDVVGQMNGEIINMARIAREAGIDPKSAERYFELLADTLVGFYLPSYQVSVRKAQLQHPKFYLFDVGVARAVRKELTLDLEPHTGPFGRCFEHFIIQQIRALNDYNSKDYTLSYIRTKDGVESDLVITRPGNSTLFIEIKSTDHPESLMLKDFQELAKDAKAESWVLCRTDRASTDGPTKIYPWRQGIKALFS